MTQLSVKRCRLLDAQAANAQGDCIRLSLSGSAKGHGTIDLLTLLSLVNIFQWSEFETKASRRSESIRLGGHSHRSPVGGSKLHRVNRTVWRVGAGLPVRRSRTNVTCQGGQC